MSEQEPTSLSPLKNGNPQHQLTTEERRKGAYRSHEVRRERREAWEAKVEQALSEKTDLVLKSWLKQGEEDWRAYQALVHESYGKPGQRVEITDGDGEPIDFARSLEGGRATSLTDVLAFAEAIGAGLASGLRTGAARDALPPAADVLPDPPDGQ